MARIGSVGRHLFSSRSILLALGAVVLICGAPPAFGDPLVITVGGVSLVAGWTGSDPPFGFGLTGDQTSIGGITFAQAAGSFVNQGDLITLGDTISVSANPQTTGPSAQTVGGVTYSDVFLAGTLHFAAAPATLTASAFTTPFTMAGSISLYRPDSSNPFLRGDLLFTVPIEGRGTASLGVVPRGGMLEESSVAYSFAPAAPDPTPEPGTLALLGCGLVLAIGRARRVLSPIRIRTKVR